MRQILDETLRLWPTAPGFTRYPYEDTVIGGRYAIPAGTPLTVLTAGAAPRPDRLGGRRRGVQPRPRGRRSGWPPLPPNAYKPFGTGQRACIGRQFALQEATLVLGMLLQRFEFVDHLDYQLHIKTTLTIKPDELLHPGPAAGPDVIDPARRSLRRRPRRPSPAPRTEPVPPVAPHGGRLSVLFGSNLGTAEAIATRLAQEGTERGFDVTLGALDEHVDDLPRDGATMIVCSSYNGTPPDNAAAFCRWIAGAPSEAAPRASPTRSSAAATPSGPAPTRPCRRMLDQQLEAHGGRRLHPRGEGNAAGDFDAAYRAWHGDLWTDVATALGLPADVAAPAPTGPRLSITLTNRQVTNPVIMSYRARAARIRANRELLAAGPGGTPDRSTRHIEIALPEDMPYRAGDHLGVLPRNSIDLIRRVIARFGLDAGQYLTIIPNGGTHTHLPIDEPAPLLGVLASCVELQDVAAPRRHRDRWPATPTTRRRRPRWSRSPARTRSPRPATGSRCSRPTGRCSTCSTSSPPAGCRSRSTSTCCRRCAPATTPSPPRP